MPINPAFTNQDFWNAFALPNAERNTSADATYQWLEALNKDFTVITHHREYVETAAQLRETALHSDAINQLEAQMTNRCEEYENYNDKIETLKKELATQEKYDITHFKEKRTPYQYTEVTFHFPLPLQATMQLVLSVDENDNHIFSQDVYLFTDDEKYTLGYKDDHCGIAYLLRLEELNGLLEYWKKGNSTWAAHIDVAFLLLSTFVAVDSHQEKKQLQQQYNRAINSLGAPSLKTITYIEHCQWVETKKGFEYIGVTLPKFLQHLANPIQVNENSIKVMSGSYRRQNYGKQEDWTDFPFELWNTIIKELSNDN